MTLIARFARMFRADVNAVLDSIEEPDVLLGQAVLDMEEDMSRDEQRMQSLENELRRIVRCIEDQECMLGDLDDELDVCFASDDDDLARSVLRKKLEAKRTGQVLGQQKQSVATELEEVKVRLGENRVRLREMKQKADLVSARNARATGGSPATSGPFSVTEDDVEVAFLRERQQRGKS